MGVLPSLDLFLCSLLLPFSHTHIDFWKREVIKYPFTDLVLSEWIRSHEAFRLFPALYKVLRLDLSFQCGFKLLKKKKGLMTLIYEICVSSTTQPTHTHAPYYALKGVHTDEVHLLRYDAVGCATDTQTQSLCDIWLWVSWISLYNRLVLSAWKQLLSLPQWPSVLICCRM